MHLNRVELKDEKAIIEDRLLKELNTRIRSVEQGPDGLIYVGTDSGELLRLQPLTYIR
jgi:aldose sugar dehydrogenase